MTQKYPREEIKVSLRKVLISFFALVFVGAGIFVLFVHPPRFLRVQEVVIETPLNHITENDLIRLAEVKRGMPLFRLRLSKVRENLLRYPWIQEVVLSKQIPNRLVIQVKEQKPVALLESEALYLVSEEGKIFKKMESNDPKDLPILTGLKKENITNEVQKTVELLKLFEKNEPIKILGISEVHWDERHELTLFTKEPCIRITLGDPKNSDWAVELERFAKAWETIRNTSRKPKVVDLTYPKKILVKDSL